jgi:hypothetical protein
VRELEDWRHVDSTVSPAPHPVVGFAARLEAVLDTLADAPVWSMTTDEQAETLVLLTRAVSRVAELRLRVLAQADTSDVAAETGATSTGAWLGHATRQSRSAAHADVRLATALERDHGAVRAALAEGQVGLEQAQVILRAFEQLPESVDAATRELAEKHLLDLAADHDPTELKLLGRRRRHQRRERPTALPVPPSQGPQPRLRAHAAPQRQGRVPPTHVRHGG